MRRSAGPASILVAIVLGCGSSDTDRPVVDGGGDDQLVLPMDAAPFDGGPQSPFDASAAAADWTERISGPGVVWYHNFDKSSEVDAFRWMNGVGNDPSGNGDRAGAPDGQLHCHWVASGGADGAGYMQVDRPAGTDDVAYWYRPFNAFDGKSNGRGIDDPGAGHSVPLAKFDPHVTSELYAWGSASNPKPGWYGPSPDAFFDGSEFFFQIRLMADPRRTTPGNIQGGKFVWLTTTNASYVPQELVTYQAYTKNTTMHAVGEPNYLNIYRGSDFSDVYSASTQPKGLDIQLGSELGECEPYNGQLLDGCWSYAVDGTWDTLLYHVVPGPSGAPTTKLQVFAAHAGQTKYTKITDITLAISYDKDPNSVGAVARAGWNAMILGTYANGFQGKGNSAFWSRYDQLIFSKQFIPCPKG